MGGMGLRSAKSHASADYLGSTFLCTGLVKRLVGVNAEPIDQEPCLDEYREVSGQDTWCTLGDVLVRTQRGLSGLIDTKEQSGLLASANDQRERARLHWVISPHSRDWLMAVSSFSLGLRLYSEEFQVCAQGRLDM